MIPRTELPWDRNTLPEAAHPSRCVVGHWNIGVYRSDRGRITAKLWRVIPCRETHERWEGEKSMATVADGEAWCEAMFAFLASAEPTILCRRCGTDLPAAHQMFCAHCRDAGPTTT